jgi:hypothetical protein
MRHQQDLQNALSNRLRRLLDAGHATSGQEIRLVTSWISGQPALRGILAEAEQVEPGLNFSAWENSLVSPILNWPSRTDAGRATLAWKLMQHVADDPDLARRMALGNAFSIGHTGTADDRSRVFVEMIFRPLFDFLIEQVGTRSSVLCVLERFLRRVEWFDREQLHDRFKRSSIGEEIYNLDLQRFLFLDGDYITYAKARSASGEPDLVGDLDTDDPLVCEGKIFDGDGRGKSYLAKGVNQIIQYANDHNKNVAYLVIFNMTDKLLQLQSAGPENVWPPYIEQSGVRVYFVIIRALPPETTASKQGKPTPIMITREDLINPDV